MIENRFEKKTYVKTEEVLVSEKRYCDVCGAEIKGPHWGIFTGHNDWGNDSPDSYEHLDACSRECLNKLFNDYIDKSSYRNNTRFFEIEHVNHAGARGDITYAEN